MVLIIADGAVVRRPLSSKEHSMGSQRVEHDSVTEQQHLEVKGKIDACVHSALPAILTQDFLPCPAS